METAVKVPLSERINFRLVIFIGVIALMVGYPVYVLIDQQVSGGIKSADGGYKEVNLKAMSTFTFDQENGSVNEIPEKWRQLDGQKVILQGEMWQPTTAGDEVQNFDLCYSIAKCCFNGPPLVQHFVKSRPMANARIYSYSGQVEVRGVLHVKVKKDETGSKVASIYQFDVESLKPVE